jgi:hypothetical protein
MTLKMKSQIMRILISLKRQKMELQSAILRRIKMRPHQRTSRKVIILIRVKYARAAVSLISVSLTAQTKTSLKKLYVQAYILNGGGRSHQLMDILTLRIYSQQTGTHSDLSLLPQQNHQLVGGSSFVQWISN